jgi:hypothetical protein
MALMSDRIGDSLNGRRFRGRVQRTMSLVGQELSKAMTVGTSAVRGKPERRPHGLDRCS